MWVFYTEVLTTVQTGCIFFFNFSFQWYFDVYTLINSLYLRIFLKFYLGNAPVWEREKLFVNCTKF